jgi:hypothetical protein
MRRHGAKVLGRQPQAAISVEPRYPTRGDLLLDQPFGVTRLMEVGPSLAAQPPAPAKTIAASSALNGAPRRLEFGIGAHRLDFLFGARFIRRVRKPFRLAGEARSVGEANHPSGSRIARTASL